MKDRPIKEGWGSLYYAPTPLEKAWGFGPLRILTYSEGSRVAYVQQKGRRQFEVKLFHNKDRSEFDRLFNHGDREGMFPTLSAAMSKAHRWARARSRVKSPAHGEKT